MNFCNVLLQWAVIFAKLEKKRKNVGEKHMAPTNLRFSFLLKR